MMRKRLIFEDFKNTGWNRKIKLYLVLTEKLTEHLNQIDKGAEKKLRCWWSRWLDNGGDRRTEDVGSDGIGVEDE